MRTAKSILILAAVMVVAAPPAAGAPMLNEFHYDNSGADVGEFVEVVLSGGTNPADVTVTLYNGNGGAQYAAHNVGSSFTSHGILADGNDYYSLAISGLQNGAPDGIAVDVNGVVAEFWSYEGVFAAVDGPAAALTSVDVGVAEPSSTAPGSSLQRLAFGSTWVLTEGSSTLGAINVPEPATLLILTAAGLPMLLKRRRNA